MIATGSSGTPSPAASRAAPRSRVVHAAIGLAGAIDEHPRGPALLQPVGGGADRFAVAGTTGHWIGAAGADDRAQQRDFEQLGLGHERHGAAKGMAQQRRIQVGAVVGYHHQSTLLGHVGVAGGAAPEQQPVDRKHQQIAHQPVGEARASACCSSAGARLACAAAGPASPPGRSGIRGGYRHGPLLVGPGEARRWAGVLTGPRSAAAADLGWW